jgi:hypothetical protein
MNWKMTKLRNNVGPIRFVLNGFLVMLVKAAKSGIHDHFFIVFRGF